MTNPIKAFFDIKPGERLLSLVMFFNFFLIITCFWILKPIKKAIFVSYYDKQGLDLFSWHLNAAQAEQIAKVLNLGVAFLAMVVFTWLVKHFVREKLTYIFSLFLIFCGTGFMLLINNASSWVVWSFYLYGDLYTTLMVATFFAFLNDSVTTHAAKRLYGIIGLGGVLGGVLGSTLVKVWAAKISSDPMLFIGTAMMLTELIMVLAYFAGRLVNQQRRPIRATPPPASPELPARNVAFEGARIVMRSRYLMSIVAIVGLYEIISTILDFQFVSTILHYLDGGDIGEQFATAYAIMNWVSLFVQLFLTSLIMTNYGIMIALLVLPIALASGSAIFMLAPVLWLGTLIPTLDGGLSYSINQSAKETLYVPTTVEEKYKAKAFIDMFVQRFAKTIAVGLTLVITVVFTDFAAVRWLSLLTIVLSGFWIAAVRHAGRKFEHLEREQASMLEHSSDTPIPDPTSS